MKNSTYKQLIEFVRNSVIGEGLPKRRENADFMEMLSLSKVHHIDNVIYPLLTKIKGFEASPIGEKLKNIYFQNIVKQENQEKEAKRVMDAFEANKIEYMPLKGYIIKDLYRKKELRQSTDIDIYVPVKYNSFVVEVMKNLGYDFDEASIGLGMHDNYHYGIYTDIEIHKNLMSPTFPKWCKFCEEILKNIKKTDGYDYRYEFSKEDYYLYILLHAIKHLKYSSCGIKPIIDIWVYTKEYDGELDWEYINGMLKKYDLLDVANNLKALSDYWFLGIEPENEIIYEFSDYVIESGAVGTSKQYFSGRMTDETKLAKIKRMVFIPFDEMKLKYPILKKLPFLLPVMWIYRGINRFIVKNNVLTEELSNSDVIDIEEAKNLSNFKKELGL